MQLLMHFYACNPCVWVGNAYIQNISSHRNDKGHVFQEQAWIPCLSILLESILNSTTCILMYVITIE